jgi:hypothetical protein
MDSSSNPTSDYFYQSLQNIYQIWNETSNLLQSHPLVEKMSDEINKMSKQIQEDTNENVDILKSDVSKVTKQLYESLFTSKSLQLNADQIRQKTIQELYLKIKGDVVHSRKSCRCSTIIPTKSNKIISELSEQLKSEGFDVSIEEQEESYVLGLEW